MLRWRHDVILAGKDIAIVFWYKMRCTELVRKLLSEFQILESEFQFDNFSSVEFKKKSHRILWNQKRNRNFASDGAPKNWNQKSEFPTKPTRVWILCLLVIAHGLQCLGRHLQLITVDVDPGSKRTFSSVRDLTEDVVSTTAMLVGVSVDALGIAIVVVKMGALAPILVLHANIITTI
jgi:hypothetical protein